MKSLKVISTAVFAVLITGLFSGCEKKNLNSQTASLSVPSVNSIPQRIVSLSPAASEILCAIGAYDQIAARTDFCDYPPEISKIPSTGGFDGKTLSIETILSFNPDFVYASKGMHDQLLPLLKQQNIQYYVSEADSVEAVLSEIEEIGRITGHSAQAEKVISEMKKDLNETKKLYSRQMPVSVYWEVWNPPYMSIGKDSFINELIEIAGGKNIFAGVAEPYPVVSEEAVISAEPQVIIVPDTMKDACEEVKARKNWKSVPAVQYDRIYAFDADMISRPGPRIAEAARLIGETIHR